MDPIESLMPHKHHLAVNSGSYFASVSIVGVRGIIISNFKVEDYGLDPAYIQRN